MRKGNTVVVAHRARLWRKTTDAEKAEWYADLRAEIAAAKAAGEETFHIAMDSGGESRLPPQITRRADNSGDFTVVRARARAYNGYHNALSGCALVADSDGAEWFAHREDLLVVAGDPTTAPSKMAPKREGIDAEIEAFVKEVSAMKAVHDERTCGNLWKSAIEAGSPTYTVFDVKWGRKYAKIVSGDYKCRRGSVYCFVDRSNGDILKAASASAPAKHARGNILRDDRMEAVGPYGAKYMR